MRRSSTTRRGESSRKGGRRSRRRSRRSGRAPRSSPSRRAQAVRRPRTWCAFPARRRRAPFRRERLTGTEQDAFRRIAEALGVGMPAERRGEAKDKPVAPPRDRPPSRRPPRRSRSAPAPATDADVRLLDKLPLGIVDLPRSEDALRQPRASSISSATKALADFVAAGGADAIFPGGSPDWSKADREPA